MKGFPSKIRADLPSAGEGAVGPLGSSWIWREAIWSRMSCCSNQAPLQLVTPTPLVGGLRRDLSCCEGLHQLFRRCHPYRHFLRLLKCRCLWGQGKNWA